jgi:hypothetical protein
MAAKKSKAAKKSTAKKTTKATPKKRAKKKSAKKTSKRGEPPGASGPQSGQSAGSAPPFASPDGKPTNVSPGKGAATPQPGGYVDSGGSMWDAPAEEIPKGGPVLKADPVSPASGGGGLGNGGALPFKNLR